MIKIAVAGTRGFPGIQGGVESHCEKLYTHLVNKGCDITVFTRKPYINYRDDVFKGIRLIHLDCPRDKFLEAIVHTFKSILRARKLRPDVIHIHAIGPSLFAPFARFFGMKVVVTNHGPDYMRKKWPLPAKIFLRFCERMGVTFANGIIAIAENISNDIKRNYGKDSAVIPNGVDVPVPLRTGHVLERLGIQKKKYILAVGRFVPEKGFDDLIEAFERLHIEDWALVIAGNADHEDDYSRNLKGKAGHSRNIVLTGFLTGRPLHELYSHAGIFVLPSYHEGLPIVLLEAMSYGLSCVASDIPANRNVSLSEDRFFKVGDTGSLEQKMREFINKPWGENEREKQIRIIAEKYDWGKIAEETLKVYNRVVI